MSDSQTGRTSLFAVWHWPWRTWVVCAPLLLVAYFLSAPPLDYVLTKVPYMNRLYPWAIPLYRPAMWVARNSEIVAGIWKLEDRALESAFGPL